MKKAYLVLENGCVITGQTNLDCNVLGKTAFNGSTAVLHSGNTDCHFQMDSAPTHMPYEMIGKIVVDELPLEYHMYDVKSTYSA
jgi:hypothetical protein